MFGHNKSEDEALTVYDSGTEIDEDDMPAARLKGLDEQRETLHKAIDDAKGSVVLIALEFDEDGDVIGARHLHVIAGPIEDILYMSKSLKKASNEVLERAAQVMAQGPIGKKKRGKKHNK